LSHIIVIYFFVRSTTTT